MVNLDCMIERLLKAENPGCRETFPLKEEEIESLCHLFKSALIVQPVLLELEPPLVVCGDVHGQYKDLLSIFDKIGPPTTRNYLFLGDYVDRGQKSLECYCLLMALKIKHPLNLFLLRGNHESSDLNKIYGFYDECKRKFSVRLFKSVTDTFLYLPVAAVVANRVFCVHGGLSPLLKTLE
jgi:serine/threonine-protein phosphatase PP1 catalytic subunit